MRSVINKIMRRFGYYPLTPDERIMLVRYAEWKKQQAQRAKFVEHRRIMRLRTQNLDRQS